MATPTFETADTRPRQPRRKVRRNASADRDAPRWEVMLAKLDSDCAFGPLARYAREKRAEGVRFDAFLDQVIAGFELCEQCDRLNGVFELSSAEGGNMSQAAIEGALARVKAGASAADAYAHAKSIDAGRRKRPVLH